MEQTIHFPLQDYRQALIDLASFWENQNDRFADHIQERKHTYGCSIAQSEMNERYDEADSATISWLRRLYETCQETEDRFRNCFGPANITQRNVSIHEGN